MIKLYGEPTYVMRNKVIRISQFRSCFHFFICRIEFTIADVIPDRTGKEVGILQDNS